MTDGSASLQRLPLASGRDSPSKVSAGAMTPAFAPPCPFLSQLSSSSDLPADGANSGTHSPDWGAGHQRRAVTMASAGGGVHSKRRRGSHVLGVALLSRLACLGPARRVHPCAAAPNGVTGRRDSDLIRVVLGEDPPDLRSRSSSAVKHGSRPASRTCGTRERPARLRTGRWSWLGRERSQGRTRSLDPTMESPGNGRRPRATERASR